MTKYDLIQLIDAILNENGIETMRDGSSIVISFKNDMYSFELTKIPQKGKLNANNS